MQSSHEALTDKIEFTEILGRYSFKTSINNGAIDGIVNLTELAPNGVVGRYPYIYGYYNASILTLTGIWSTVSYPYAYPESACVFGAFKFYFYKKNGKIGFNGTWGCGRNQYGGLNGVDYWNGVKIENQN
ncbi:MULTISPECIES: hypothetical protein [Clostridium]|uniref:Uncharacterized protein n=1 Tax=Clostridium beijerinckii TaxID=1520 RepID=A0A1S9N0J3_CLOBE|nr:MULTISPECIES: hypothetical protein [Clostridium]MBN7576786.1 hypothetical protein [Clostridium beijerinckii]MBN7581795.1 hypothetical protein [Clostridium beijerinckii]MBN7586543.1 hypothetical protein [Clostridium beijerinckii]MBO0522633.1 hypothetical protein [Clostridium beijerinckii]MZK53273.1 hypothetical protein [Clostridium beijerinckii]